MNKGGPARDKGCPGRCSPRHDTQFTAATFATGVRQYAVSSSVSLMRPELVGAGTLTPMAAMEMTMDMPPQVEIKNTIKNLKKEAEMRLTLDVEAQQSFDFLSDQVQGLRKAFSTLSDVLIEEVDLIRAEASDRQEEQQQRSDALAKALKVWFT